VIGGDLVTGRASVPALARKALWRTVLTLTGGLRVDGAAALPAGPCVIVFPEGTRSRDGRTGDFHRGAARLAAEAGVPPIPAGIGGTRRLLPPGGSARRPQRAPVIVRFGAPVSLAAPAGAGTGGDAVTDATAQARAQVAALVID
jgi:1-acyl-sn-glycerol-3-phosphate acyltransferase